MKYLFTVFTLVGFFLFGCNSNRSNPNSPDMNSLLNSELKKAELSISEESLYSIINSLPSPLEIAALIKGSGVSFNESLLNQTENAVKYTTDFEKSLAMGIYSGNLGYINVYEKSFLAIKYLTAIKSIADDLKIGQFFDFETIRRLASHSDKLDSLIYLSSVNFERMDQFLRSQMRSNLSVLLVTGTWMESLYLATQVVKSKPNEGLIERIGEQKMIIDQVLLILTAYEDEEFFENLIHSLKELKMEYDKVTIEYNYREPSTQEINGRLVIVDNSSTEVIISHEQVARIGEIIERIRTNIVNSNY